MSFISPAGVLRVRVTTHDTPLAVENHGGRQQSGALLAEYKHGNRSLVGKETELAESARARKRRLQGLTLAFVPYLWMDVRLDYERCCIMQVRDAFAAAPGKLLIVADYGQIELRVLAHVYALPVLLCDNLDQAACLLNRSNCKSMIDAFKAGGDFHSRTAMGLFAHLRTHTDARS